MSHFASFTGILQSDTDHDTSLYRVKALDIVLTLASIVLVVGAHSTLILSDGSHSGIPSFFLEPAYFIAVTLAADCFMLSGSAFTAGRTRMCIWWTVPLLPLGCLFWSPRMDGFACLVLGAFTGSIVAVFAFLCGVAPCPEYTEFQNLRKAHIYAFLTYLCICMVAFVIILNAEGFP